MKDNIVKGEERKLDTELKRLNVEPRIYHFTTNCDPFRGITIAVADSRSWSNIREILDTVQYALNISEYIRKIHNIPIIERATRTLRTLRKMNIYGVAICDPSDNFNRQEGRNKAKGRLVQHLKLMEKETSK